MAFDGHELKSEACLNEAVSYRLRPLKNCLSPSREGAKTLFLNYFATLRLCVSHTFKIIQKSQVISCKVLAVHC